QRPRTSAADRSHWAGREAPGSWVWRRALIAANRRERRGLLRRRGSEYGALCMLPSADAPRTALLLDQPRDVALQRFALVPRIDDCAVHHVRRRRANVARERYSHAVQDRLLDLRIRDVGKIGRASCRESV